MADLTVGVSSPEVAKVQKALNDAYKSSVVKVSGEFDEDTSEAVARFQQAAGLRQTGSVDDATRKALDWAAHDKREITYPKGGKTYYALYPEEYNELSKKLIKAAQAEAEYYTKMAENVAGLWTEHDKVRKNNKFFAFITEEASGANFPNASVIKAAEDGAKDIVSAAKSGDFKKYQSAVDSGSIAIRDANAAMNQYLDELYAGGAQLVVELSAIKDACVDTLELSAAIATAGESVAVTAAVMGGLGSYKALLGEIDTASTKSVVDVKEAFGKVLLAGVIEAAAGAIMKQCGEKFAKSVAENVAGAVLKKVDSAALAKFVERAIEGGAKKAAEDAIKDFCKACDPKDRMTIEQALKNAALNFAKGALLNQLNGILDDFGKNGSKIFTAKDFEGLGDVPLDKALKAGGEKQIEMAFKKYVPKALQAADGEPEKVKDQLKEAIVEDSTVQKWFADFAKKQKK